MTHLKRHATILRVEPSIRSFLSSYRSLNTVGDFLRRTRQPNSLFWPQLGYRPRRQQARRYFLRHFQMFFRVRHASTTTRQIHGRRRVGLSFRRFKGLVNGRFRIFSVLNGVSSMGHVLIQGFTRELSRSSLLVGRRNVSHVVGVMGRLIVLTGGFTGAVRRGGHLF